MIRTRRACCHRVRHYPGPRGPCHVICLVSSVVFYVQVGLTDYTHHPWSGKSYVRQLPRTFIGQYKGGRHWQPPLIWERRTLARMERKAAL